MTRGRKQTPTSNSADYLHPMDSIGYLARINFRAFSAELEKLTRAPGVRAGQWRFLRVLWEEDDLTQREVSDRVGVREATTVRAMAGLVRCGLVVRHPSTSDKRKMQIKLTRKARLLKSKLMPMVSEVNERAVSGLSKRDVDTARRVLAHTYRNLNPNMEPPE